MAWSGTLQRCAAAGASGPSSNAMTRSVYVSRLRRAFLLRAHPDRFRSQPELVRRGQAQLIQAIAERMSFSDFLAYSSGSGAQKDFDLRTSNKSSTMEMKHYPFVLERTDGVLIKLDLKLDQSVEQVLKSMREALKLIGFAGLPSPPPAPVSQENNNQKNGNVSGNGKHNNSHGRMHFAPGAGKLWESQPRGGREWHGVDHSFDINTHRGRNLKLFLKDLDPKDIEARRASRMDASAAALVARRAYGFQSIDGTSLGWSSANLAICLSTLTALFDEHGSSLQLTSFYPLRLLLSSDEIQGKIDLYDGIIMLNPAATPLQWLQTLNNVGHDDIGKYKINQTRLKQYLEIVQNSLGIKLKKGHSCSSYDYHVFMERLAIGIENRRKEEGMVISSQALALERVLVTVESSQACRRGVLNGNGSIRVGADMTGDAVSASVARLSIDARKKVIKQADLLQTVKTNIGRAQEEFGFDRVYRAGLPKVTSEEVLTCLSTLFESTELEQLKSSLAGKSLGIAGSGHYCHLGDDGSIVVPWDWQTR